MKRLLIAAATLATLMALVPAVRAQQADFGDAPEGAPAYPWLGVPGNFPTCLGGPAGFIRHRPSANLRLWFGPGEDWEVDGNAGVCPAPPYEQDECYGPVDVDGGLVYPSAFTINAAANPVLCSAPPMVALGTVCTPGTWGVDIDAQVTNATNVPGFLNVIIDWDQSGSWGGGLFCGTTPAPEHIVVDVGVPPGYVGSVSGLPGISNFVIGPKAGFVWMRMTLTELPIGAAWDGRGLVGLYDMGETEDYLIAIHPAGTSQSDFGDAPENALAYPPTGVIGQFPTCMTVGPLGSFMRHANPTGNAFLGTFVDLESDGNTGDCAWVAYDRDECNFSTGDAGLFIVQPHTIVGGAIVACPGSNGRPLSPACGPAMWGQAIDLRVVNNTNINLVLNGVADWNQNGRWGGFGCAAGGAREWFLQNFVIPAGYVGPLSALGPPPFLTGSQGFAWMRFSLTEGQILSNDWDGSGNFREGETEDYLINISDPAGVQPELHGELQTPLFVNPASPNPFAPATTISWSQARAGKVTVTVHDVQGRVVARLVDAERPAGTNSVRWDGTDADGRTVGAGFYILRVESGGEVRTQKVVRTK